MNPPKLTISCVEALLTQEDIDTLTNRKMANIRIATNSRYLSGARTPFSMVVVGEPDMKKLAILLFDQFYKDMLATDNAYDAHFLGVIFGAQYYKTGDRVRVESAMDKIFPSDKTTPMDQDARNDMLSYIIERNMIELRPISTYMVDGEFMHACV